MSNREVQFAATDALERLRELSSLELKPGDSLSVLSPHLHGLLAVCGTDRGCLLLYDRDSGVGRVAAQQGLGVAYLQYLLHEGESTPSMGLRQPYRRLIIPDVAAEPLLHGTKEQKLLMAESIRALVTVPIASRAGERLGMLMVAFRTPRRPSAEELQYLELSARLAADCVLCRDLDDRVLQSEARVRAIASASEQCIFRMTPDWIEMRIVEGESVFGREAQLSATWLQDMVPAEDHLPMLQTIASVRKTGGDFVLDHRIQRPDGSVRWVSTRAVPVRNSAGDIVEWIGASSDITERRDSRQELQRHVDWLEESVMERTAELDAANGALRDDLLQRGRAQREHQDLLRQLSSAQENERRRISRELHDEVGQLLAALLLGINELAQQNPSGEELAAVQHLRGTAQAIATEIHNLAVELRPTSLDDLGLVRALAAYVETWSLRSKVKVEFHAVGLDESRFTPEVETTLYRIVQEALNNVLKHARASVVSVILARRGSELSVIVEDDGAGFDSDADQNPKRLGLSGMCERAQLVGGHVRVESTVGQGTTVLVRVPAS